MSLSRILEPEILALLIPIVAIIMGVAFAITKAVLRHRERLAMIQKGINPDSLNRQDSVDFRKTLG